MKIITLLSFFIYSLPIFAQGEGDIVIFSSSGEPVYVTLNGVRQNYQPETNLRLSKVTANWYKCHIESFDNRFAIDKNILVKRDTLITYQVKEKKGKYSLSFYTEIPLKTATSEQNQPQVVYHSTEIPQAQQSTTTTTSTQVITNTQTQQQPEQVGINVNMNVSEQGMGSNTSVVDPVTGESIQVNVQFQVSGNEIGQQTQVHEQTQTITYTETQTITQNTSTPNSSPKTPANCVVDESGLTYVKDAISNESFSENQQRIARQFIKNKCLTVSQIKEIVNLFTFSEDKLSISKYAYDYCLNKGDYYQLLDAFTFSADKEELEEFLETK